VEHIPQNANPNCADGEITFQRRILGSLLALSQGYPDDDENDDGPEASTSKFLSAIAGNQPAK
jgi:hypothetical protein